MKILISGGSGLVGRSLSKLLKEKGHEVAWLGRSKGSGTYPSFLWDPTKGSIDSKAIDWADAIVHLAGAGVADKRWTKARKKEILDSRVLSTQLLCKAIKEAKKSSLVCVCASAIGIYGFEEKGIAREDSAPGSDFLAQVCIAWEKEEQELFAQVSRGVGIRVGVVLSPEGGAYKEIAKPIKWGFGAALGSGKQAVAWIHMQDLVNLFIYALENDNMSGFYNGVAPKACSNWELTKAIAKKVKKPLILPAVPGFALKMMVGEMAYMLLGGREVSAEKVLATGFSFKYTEVQDAVMSL